MPRASLEFGLLIWVFKKGFGVARLGADGGQPK